MWDFEDLSRRPPWGDDIADTITALSNYFVTSDGRDLFEVFEEAFAAARELKESIVIRG